MRSLPASGAIVTERVSPLPRAAASSGPTRSALSDEGEARPPRRAISLQSAAMPGWLAISAPTKPTVLRCGSASSMTVLRSDSSLRWRTGRYMKPAAQKRQPHSQPRLASTTNMSPKTASGVRMRVWVGASSRRAT